MVRVSRTNINISTPSYADITDSVSNGTDIDRFELARPRDPNKVVAPTVVIPQEEKLLFKWSAAKPTWRCPNFLMQEAKEGGDVDVNLYADGGILQQYDAAFNECSQAYEKEKFSKPFNANRRLFGWWGHGQSTCAVACLLQEPKREVALNGESFSPHAIKGLLCRTIDALHEVEAFAGVSDRVEPENFLEKVLKGWAQRDRTAIVIDVCPGNEVENRTFDRGELFLQKTGNEERYRVELESAGYEYKQTYRFFIQRDDDGNVIKSDWIPGLVVPNIAWRQKPIGDLSLEETWLRGEGALLSNPHIKLENVWELYKRSI